MKCFPLVMICICALMIGNAQTFNKRVVKTGLFIPWEIIYGPDDNIWLTQKNGHICRVDPATGHTDTLYHETNNVIQSEGGMLGMALHPSFPNQPYVYVAYQYTQGTYKERIVRYTYYPVGDTLGTPMIFMDNISGNNYHNGCRLTIANNKLFIATGDAGNGNSAQNLISPNGKIHRINLDGSIPNDNPIVGSSVWSWGHRNTQGMVYANGRLYTSMHGDITNDEVNIIEPGRNYGWPYVEGYCDQPGEMQFCTDSNVAEPIYTWSPTVAPAGIDHYDHPMFPQWQNSLMMCTLKDTSLWILKLNSNHDSVVAAIRIDSLHVGRIRDICLSPNGRIFLSTSNTYRGDTGTRVDKIIELSDSSYLSVNTVAKGNTTLLSIYPNPTNDEIRVTIRNTSMAGMLYFVINGLGQVVKEGKTDQNNISLKNLPAGLYQLRLRGREGETYAGKILKE